MLISIVIPVFNEQETIDELYLKTSAVLNSLTADWEVICVNDGSSDNTFSKLISVYEKDRRWKIISFSKNFGHQRAVWAGLNHARGEYVGVMDGDLQDNPAYFSAFYSKLSSDTTDVVYATRTMKKEEGIFKRLTSHWYYLVMKNLFGVNVPADSGDFCMMKGTVAREIVSMPEHSLFIRGIRAWVGFRQEGMSCERNERFKGETKYSLRKMLRLAYDGMFSFSDFPIKFLGRMGLVIIIFSILYTIFLLYKKFILHEVLEGFTTLIMAVLFFGGVQLITVRILGEYLYRVYNESRKRPLYIISNKYGDLKENK